MKVLVACEYSGVVREAFRARGHDAWSCDLLESDDNSPYHIMGDATQLLDQRWDMLIAHPPCTYLANSGVRWLYSDESRWEKMRDGAALFRAFWEASIPRICIENPIMHGHAKNEVGCGQQTQTIQPWQFGHGETKATCLWLKGLPPLVPTDIVEGREQRIWKLPPSADRWKERSKTFDGIAAAMASQWG